MFEESSEKVCGRYREVPQDSLCLFAQLVKLAEAGKTCVIEIEWHGWMQLRKIVLRFDEGAFANATTDDIYRALALQLATAMLKQTDPPMIAKYNLTLDKIYAQVWIWIYLDCWSWMCGSTPYLQHMCVVLISQWAWDMSNGRMVEPEAGAQPNYWRAAEFTYQRAAALEGGSDMYENVAVQNQTLQQNEVYKRAMYSLCEHGRRRNRCRECGGSNICEHGRQRSNCKECGGASICQHKRQRSECKECGGAGICEHGRRRNTCNECGGSNICKHGRQPNKCIECRGASICQHGRQRNTCNECGGASMCQHGRVRTQCKDCGGASICQHKRRRSLF